MCIIGAKVLKNKTDGDWEMGFFRDSAYQINKVACFTFWAAHIERVWTVK